MFQRLKKRRDFLAAAAGKKSPARAFTLQFRRREDDGTARFGYTVSKRVAKKAVERNRIRRRLKEAVRQLRSSDAEQGWDYVLVGRRDGLTQEFARLAADLARSLERAAAYRKARKPVRSEGHDPET